MLQRTYEAASFVFVDKCSCMCRLTFFRGVSITKYYAVYESNERREFNRFRRPATGRMNGGMTESEIATVNSESDKNNIWNVRN